MVTIVHDLRFALRAIVRRPGFAAVTTATLALGIGVNTAMFSMVNAALLRPWPGVRDVGELVWITHDDLGRTQRLSYPDFGDYRDRVPALGALAGYDRVAVNLSFATWSEREMAQAVTASYFELLGVRPYAGRLLVAGDGDAARVAVLSHACWRERFGGDPSVVGRTITANGVQLEVIGVAAEGFFGTEMEDRPALWAPVGALRAAQLESRDSAWLSVLGRLRPGVAVGEVAAAVNAVCAASAPLRAADRGRLLANVSRVHGWVPPGQGGDLAAPVVLGLAVTGLVLLIAAANFANLLLVRVSERGRELAVRASLGASRSRMLRLLLAESALLALLGGAGGLLVAAWGTPALAAAVAAPPNLRPVADLRVAVYAAAVALAVGLVFGLAPARGAARHDLADALKVDGRTGGGDPRRRRIHSALVTGQVALSLVLLVVAALLLKSLARATALDLGIDRERAARVVALSFDLTAQGAGPEARTSFRRELLARAQALPGAHAAALAETLPLAGRAVGEQMRVAEGNSGSGTGSAAMVLVDTVSPGYLATLGIELVAGRDLAEADTAGAPPVALVNETMAARLWPGRSPLGEAVVAGDPETAHEVVGVVRDGKYLRVGEPPRAMMYASIFQREPIIPDTTLVVWCERPLEALALVRDELRGLDPRLPVFDVRTLDEVLAGNLAERRQGSVLLAGFGALALALAVVGLTGVLTHLVGRRTREIGTRLALGATSAMVARHFLRDGIRLGALGIAIGIPLALAAGALLRGMLLGIDVVDGAVVALVALLLAVLTAAASALPAWRASRVDPVEALRCE